MPTDPHHTPTIIPPSTLQPQGKQRPRKLKTKDIEIPQSSVLVENVADKAVYEERDDSLERATTTATGLDAEQDRVGRSAQVVSSKDEGLGDQEDASKEGRKIDDINKDAEVTFINETQGRYDDAQMFDIDVFNGEEVFIAEQVKSFVVHGARVEYNPHNITFNNTQSLNAFTFRDPVESSQDQNTTPNTFKSRTKGGPPPPKAKMIKNLSALIDERTNKDLTKKLVSKLQAEEEEQARLAREKAEKMKRKARFVCRLLEKRMIAALSAHRKRGHKPPAKTKEKVPMSNLSIKMAGYKQKLVKESQMKAEEEMAPKVVLREQEKS
ncbi:hypothetical protein Tco_0576206 [Tanacetum coccineum]